MFVAIYSKELYPNDGDVFNKECDSREECVDVLHEEYKKVGYANFWSPHIFNIETNGYEKFTNDELNKIWGK